MKFDRDILLYLRERQLNRAFDFVHKQYNKYDVTHEHVAERLNMSLEAVKELLSTPKTWTLDTVSDLLFVLEAELEFNDINFIT